MSDETRPFWTDPASPTEAYTRPPRRTWRDHAENRITWTRDLYDTINEWHDTLVDWSPAIAAVVALVVLIWVFHR